MIPQKFMFKSPAPHPKKSLEDLCEECVNDPYLTSTLEYCARWANKTEERMLLYKEEFVIAVLQAATDANPELVACRMVVRSIEINSDLWALGVQFKMWAESADGQRFKNSLPGIVERQTA